ncbi:hypothetical protein S7335_207 [Synechococcus sp. PCC 7335]|nr:hypothetical protein S7335_207 [Synechococcus sp. PCC 7335]
MTIAYLDRISHLLVKGKVTSNLSEFYVGEEMNTVIYF